MKGDACQRCQRLGHKCSFASRSSRRIDPFAQSQISGRDTQNSSSSSISRDDGTAPDLQSLESSRIDRETSAIEEQGDRQAEEHQVAGHATDALHNSRSIWEDQNDYLSHAQPSWSNTPDNDRVAAITNRMSTLKKKVAALVSKEEAIGFFDVYFEKYAPYCPVLFYTNDTVEELWKRSPLLYTLLCSLGSRNYLQRPNMCKSLFELAEQMMAEALISSTGEYASETVEA